MWQALTTRLCLNKSQYSVREPAMEKKKTICMRCCLWCFALMVTLLSGIATMPVSVVDSHCTAPSTAKYRLTFTGKWSQTSFPKQYPVYRPPAQWSPLIGEWNTLECQGIVELTTAITRKLSMLSAIKKCQTLCSIVLTSFRVRNTGYL